MSVATLILGCLHEVNLLQQQARHLRRNRGVPPRHHPGLAACLVAPSEWRVDAGHDACRISLALVPTRMIKAVVKRLPPAVTARVTARAEATEPHPPSSSRHAPLGNLHR